MSVIKYLDSVPNYMSFTIIVLGILSIMVISLKGKLMARWGKNVIGIGDAASTEGPSHANGQTNTQMLSPSIQAIPNTISRIHKRQCGDCILILMGQREKYELEMSMAENKKMKQSMTYAEQKLLDMLSLLDDIFINALESSKANRLVDNNSYDVQNKMFYGLIKDSLIQIKDEIRRSFKENGFYELNEVEFSNYVKDKNRKIISLIVNYVKTIYPTTGVAVEGTNLVADIEFNSVKFQEILFDIFMNAKRTIVDIDSEVSALKKSFAEWIDKFMA